MLNKSRWVIAVMILLQSVMLSYFWLTRPVQLALFDVKTTVQGFSSELANSNLSDESKIALTKQFSLALTKTIGSYSEQHHVVLLNPAMVITPLPDVTANIQAAIAQALSQPKSSRHD